MRFTRAFKINLYTLAIVMALSTLPLGAQQRVAAEVPGLEDVKELKRVQSRVFEVVSKVMPACVSISDGVGAGSGVIVSADGLILTAGHVMTESRIYEIILPSGQTVKAKPLGKNLDNDAGMLQIIGDNSTAWPHVNIERTKTLKLNQWVVSLGHSGGFEIGRTPPVRTGRVLKVSKSQVVTDAVLIGGDSGGPLFNLDGDLVGIHSSIGDTIAENRHVSMPAFLKDWDRLKAGLSWGKLPQLENPIPTKRRGVIGVRVDLSAPNCRIRIVNSGSSAEEAGILVGDIVLQFNDIRIYDGQHLIDVIKRFNGGDVCRMQVLRDSQIIALEIQLK